MVIKLNHFVDVNKMVTNKKYYMIEKSESIKNIAAALRDFNKKMKPIKKDSVNAYLKNKYASLSSILEAISSPLYDCDLSFSQMPNGDGNLYTILIHNASGEYIASNYSMQLPIEKKDPQKIGSLITYQRRYALQSILGLNIDDDDDGNTASSFENFQIQKTDQPKNLQLHSKQNNDLPWLNKATAEWDNAVNKIISGAITFEKLLEHYKVNRELRAELTQLVK